MVLQLVSLQEGLLPFPSNLLPAVLGLMCKVAPHTDLWDFSAAVGALEHAVEVALVDDTIVDGVVDVLKASASCASLQLHAVADKALKQLIGQREGVVKVLASEPLCRLTRALVPLIVPNGDDVSIVLNPCCAHVASKDGVDNALAYLWHVYVLFLQDERRLKDKESWVDEFARALHVCVDYLFLKKRKSGRPVFERAGQWTRFFQVLQAALRLNHDRVSRIIVHNYAETIAAFGVQEEQLPDECVAPWFVTTVYAMRFLAECPGPFDGSFTVNKWAASPQAGAGVLRAVRCSAAMAALWPPWYTWAPITLLCSCAPTLCTEDVWAALGGAFEACKLDGTGAVVKDILSCLWALLPLPAHGAPVLTTMSLDKDVRVWCDMRSWCR